MASWIQSLIGIKSELTHLGSEASDYSFKIKKIEFLINLISSKNKKMTILNFLFVFSAKNRKKIMKKQRKFYI